MIYIYNYVLIQVSKDTRRLVDLSAKPAAPLRAKGNNEKNQGSVLELVTWECEAFFDLKISGGNRSQTLTCLEIVKPTEKLIFLHSPDLDKSSPTFKLQAKFLKEDSMKIYFQNSSKNRKEMTVSLVSSQESFHQEFLNLQNTAIVNCLFETKDFTKLFAQFEAEQRTKLEIQYLTSPPLSVRQLLLSVSTEKEHDTVLNCIAASHASGMPGIINILVLHKYMLVFRDKNFAMKLHYGMEVSMTKSIKDNRIIIKLNLSETETVKFELITTRADFNDVLVNGNSVMIERGSAFINTNAFSSSTLLPLNSTVRAVRCMAKAVLRIHSGLNLCVFMIYFDSILDKASREMVLKKNPRHANLSFDVLIVASEKGVAHFDKTPADSSLNFVNTQDQEVFRLAVSPTATLYVQKKLGNFRPNDVKGADLVTTVWMVENWRRNKSDVLVYWELLYSKDEPRFHKNVPKRSFEEALKYLKSPAASSSPSKSPVGRSPGSSSGKSPYKSPIGSPTKGYPVKTPVYSLGRKPASGQVKDIVSQSIGLPNSPTTTTISTTRPEQSVTSPVSSKPGLSSTTSVCSISSLLDSPVVVQSESSSTVQSKTTITETAAAVKKPNSSRQDSPFVAPEPIASAASSSLDSPKSSNPALKDTKPSNANESGTKVKDNEHLTLENILKSGLDTSKLGNPLNMKISSKPAKPLSANSKIGNQNNQKSWRKSQSASNPDTIDDEEQDEDDPVEQDFLDARDDDNTADEKPNKSQEEINRAKVEKPQSDPVEPLSSGRLKIIISKKLLTMSQSPRSEEDKQEVNSVSETGASSKPNTPEPTVPPLRIKVSAAETVHARGSEDKESKKGTKRVKSKSGNEKGNKRRKSCIKEIAEKEKRSGDESDENTNEDVSENFENGILDKPELIDILKADFDQLQVNYFNDLL